MHTNPKALTKYFIRFQFTAQRLTSNVSGARSRMLLCVLYKKHIFTPIGCVGNWVSLICWWIPLRVLFQDKSRKASHAWLAAGSGGDCDWCGRALTDKPSLYCESEWAKLHLIFIDLECILSWLLNIVVKLFCCLLNRSTKLRLFEFVCHWDTMSIEVQTYLEIESRMSLAFGSMIVRTPIFWHIPYTFNTSSKNKNNTSVFHRGH